MGSEEERSKLGLLALAKRLRNVAEACKKMGFSRASFYRFQEQYKSGGEASLEEASRHKPIPQNRVDPEIEAAVVELAVEQPTWGRDVVVAELRTRGLRVSRGGVRSVWQRHNLETTEKRLEARAYLKTSGEADQTATAQAGVTNPQPRDGPARSKPRLPDESTAQDTSWVIPSSHSDEVRRQRRQSTSIANAVAALAYAAITVVSLSYITVIWNPGYYGDFGLTVGDNALPADNNSWLVTELVPASPAQQAGIELGDRVDAVRDVRHVLILVGLMAPHPGEEVTLQISRGSKSRAVTLKARPLAPLTTTTSVILAFVTAANLVYLTVGLVLVLLRPNTMTWAFYLGAYAVNAATSSHEVLYPISYLPINWLQMLNVVSDVLIAAGVVGFLVFCLRFPANAPTGWRSHIDRLTPLLLVLLVAISVAEDLGVQLFLPAWMTRNLWGAWVASILTISILACVVLLATYFSTRGLEQHKIKWVVFGLLCTLIACMAIILAWGPLAGLPALLVNGLGVLIVAFPLTVAYAVLRHRVIDVRFVVSRALVFGIIAAVIATVVVCLDWLFSTKLAGSRLQTAIYAGAALLVGFSLNASRHRIATLVDSLFYRQWHRTQQQASTISDSIHRAASKADLYELLTSGMASAYCLASVALFERLRDGGLVRVAAHGWPLGTLWHLLPEDAVVKHASSLKPTNIDSLGWTEQALPVGVATPSLMIPIVSGKQVPAVLLCGAHENGTGLDPDEIRSIRMLCADAGLVYGASAPASEKGFTPLPRAGSLGA